MKSVQTLISKGTIMRTFYLAIVGLCLVPTLAAADVLVSSFVDTSNPRNNYASSLGYSFTYTGAPFEVTALGLYDGNVSGGFIDNHPITLYSSVGAVLATATVTAGTGTPGSYEYVNLVTPYTLQTGTTYVLAAYYADNDTNDVGIYTTNDTFFNSTSITPGISASGFQNRYGSPDSNSFPGGTDGPTFAGIIGPNLQGSLVPEPSAFVLASLASIGLLRRKRRQVIG
jgi:hypothetical protein